MAIGAKEVAGTESTLRSLELLVSHKLDGLLHGDHQGLFNGAGTEAGDGRLYQPGDDVRRIDWNLTARSNATHVRDTVADRELVTWLLVDGSASLDFGTARCEKRDIALAAAAAFGFLTAKAGNRLGTVVFDDLGTTVLPPRPGRQAVMSVLHRLDRRPRAGEGRPPLAGALCRTRLLASRRGLVVVVSDLLDDGDWPRQLRALAMRHEVVVAHVCDPRDVELPPVGLLTLVDPETGERREVQTASRRLRQRFAAAATAQREEAARAVRAAGATYLPLSTDRDWLLDVVRFAAAQEAAPMTFLAPTRLWLLLGVAGLLAVYLVLQHRRRQYADRFADSGLIDAVIPRRPGWRRHVTAGVAALALVILVLGLARPSREARVPRTEGVVMLALDVSASMAAPDVDPSRLAAASAAARSFVADVPEALQVGLVAFDGTANVLATPTTDRAAVLSAIDHLSLGPGTAAGDGILAALDAIAANWSADPGTDPPASIVLLSDGATTVGRPVAAAAEAATEQGIPVSTIAFGTTTGTVHIEGQVIPVPIDAATMRSVAETTGGTFFETASAGGLRRVYEDIQGHVGYTTEQREVAQTFVGAGAVALLAAAGASIVWTGRFL